MTNTVCVHQWKDDDDDDGNHDEDLSFLCPPCPNSAFVPLTPRRCRRSVDSFKRTFAHSFHHNCISAGWVAKQLDSTEIPEENLFLCMKRGLVLFLNCDVRVGNFPVKMFAVQKQRAYAHMRGMKNNFNQKIKIKIVRGSVRTCRESICGWRVCLSQFCEKRKVHEMHETGAHAPAGS